MAFAEDITTGEDLQSFLEAEGTASATVTADVDITSSDIWTVGDKTLTINSGVTVLYKRQGSYANINVDEGSKLTILGSGTFQPVMHSETNTINGFTAEISATAGNQIGNRIIDVYGGELVVGVKNDPNNCPHFITSSIARGAAVIVFEGEATFNNADMKVACMSIKNYAKTTIHGGEYVSIATMSNGINGGWYAYHLQNEGVMDVYGGHFVGVQGAFYNGTATSTANIYGGSFETVNGHNWATGEPNAKDNHYALYVATHSVVNVYGGYFKVTTPSAGGGKVALIGNNDAYNTYGLINLYGGYFQRKVEVSPRKDKESSYPASVPSTSQWYSSFGSEAPLPAGYAYQEITSGANYEAGYRWQVVCTTPPEKQETVTTETNLAEEEIAEDAVVTIGKDVEVTVEASAPGETVEVEVAQVFVNQGASLTVEEGATLTIGEGGVNVGNGGSIEIKEGATVTVGAAGIVAAATENIVLNTSEESYSTLLLAPEVTENTQPKATYKFKSKARKTDDGNIWQRFGVPTFNGATTMTWEGTVKTALFQFDYEANDWTQLSKSGDNTFVINGNPFACYNMTINENPSEDVEYTFTGNLMGNTNAPLNFVKGWNFYANSYTAPIDIKSFIAEIKETFGDGVSASIYVYKRNEDGTTNWSGVNEADFGPLGTPAVTKILPMYAFVLNLREGNSADGEINYKRNVYDPIMPSKSSAPARDEEEVDYHGAVIEVTNGAQTEKLTLIEGDKFSDEFDNGWDADKLDNKNNFSLYALQGETKLSTIATNDLTDKDIAFNNKVAGTFTLNVTKAIGEVVKIYDMVANKLIELTEGASYEFEAEAIDNAQRFIINPSDAPSAIDNTEVLGKTIKFMGADGQIYIRRAGNIYNVDGQLVR